jgi:hypothetical protein
MITEKNIKVYECSCPNCGVKFTVRDNDGIDHDYWLKKEDLEDWLNNDEGWELFNGDWYCSDCLIYDDGSVPRINEARRLLTAKEQVPKDYQYAVARSMTCSRRWRIFNGDLETPIIDWFNRVIYYSDFVQTEQQSLESALAIINQNDKQPLLNVKNLLK